MIIPKTHFERFKREFVRLQKLLGLTNYRIYFEHTELDDAFAQLDVREDGQLAVIRLCKSTPRRDDQHYGGPEIHAKHEVLHLLTHKIFWLAQERYVTEDEISREWEALVRRLEKVL